MTTSLRSFLAGVLALSGAAVAGAQPFAGSDDFSGTAAKWAYFFRGNGSATANGALTFNGSALEFTKGAGVGSYFLGWDGEPATAGVHRSAASYTTDWVMDVTATNSVTATGTEFVTTGIEAANGPGSYTAIMLSSTGTGRFVRLETNNNLNGLAVSVPTGANVRLRLAWNAAGRTLTGSYSLDAGVSFSTIGSVAITRWAALPSAGFLFEAFGNSNFAAAVPAGQVNLDNFALAAATIAGSDDFSGGSAKWATTFRAHEATAGTNGLLTFTGSVAEFTKSAGQGGHHYLWDGDGIAGNGSYQTPVSYATSWVMEATVRNSVVAEAGKFASIGIEVATAPGSYTEMLLENYGGQLLVVGEVNSPTNVETVSAPAGTDVRVRLAWNAQARTFTGSYSFNGGASFANLASVPVSAWPVSPASTGFVFSITGSVTANAAVVPGQMQLDNFSIRTAPVVTTQPAPVAPIAGAPITLSTATTSSTATVQWQRNGTSIAAATSSGLTIADAQPANAGIYQAVVTDAGVSSTTDGAIVGVAFPTSVDAAQKAIGTGTDVAANVVHANGNVFDQVLLTGGAATIRSDTGQIVRMSYIDAEDDIVQVEYSGPGTVSVVLDNLSGPALPVKYNQSVSYVKGHASIVVTGATVASNLSVFSVGKANAVNQALFRTDVTYDGTAGIASIAIASTDGKFGGLRTANASYFGTKGLTGVYAPGVQFTGPVYVGDINAFDAATPVLLIGSALGDTWINGGDLLQTNNRAVQISGVTRLHFKAGSTSHGSSLSAQANRAILEENGVVVTAEIVVNP